MRAPPAVAAQPDLRLWFDLSLHGEMAVRTGKVELGQGILTALAQIVARELGVSPSQVIMQAASTAYGPNEGFTAGSLSVEHSGAALRFVGACLRQRLLAFAAALLECPADELQVESGVVWQAGQASTLSYWTLADRLLREPAPIELEALPIAPARHDIVGMALPRVDLEAKLSGGAFIQDIDLPGMWHAKVLRQPFAGQKLIALDLAKLQSRLAQARCVRKGDFVACVANTESNARRGAALLRDSAKWQPETIDAASVGMAGQDLAAWLEQQPGTVTMLGPHSAPTPDAGARCIGTWTRPYLAHASIGLCTALAWQRDGRLDIWTHSQGIFALRDQIARVLDRPVDSVAVHHVAGAGCYGHNGADDVALDAALVAVALPGTPIRVQWTREDELCQAPFGAAMAVRIESTLDASQSIASWSTWVSSTSHGVRPGMHGEVNLLAAGAVDAKWIPRQAADVPENHGGGASRNARPIYRVGSRALAIKLVHSPLRTSAIRSLGAFANVVAIEGMMDQLAALARLDAVEFRRRHLDNARARAALDRVVAMSGWNERSHRHVGATTLGLGLAQYKGRGAYCAVVVEIELEIAVTVRHVWCAVDAGLAINPDGARNQIEGGILQSISWTLMEAVRFEGGTPLCRGWDSYPILRFGELPTIETELLGATDNASVGVGEASQGPTAAALVNAVSSAIGMRARHLPLDKDALIELLAR